MTPLRNSIRTWALVSVAVTSLALIGFSWWLIQILASPDWCNRAIGASKDARPEFAVSGCFALLKQQVSALSVNSFIALGTLALCLAVLVVIVLAGGKLSFKASKDGVAADMASDPGVAAQHVADEAQDAADEVKDTAP